MARNRSKSKRKSFGEQADDAAKRTGGRKKRQSVAVGGAISDTDFLRFYDQALAAKLVVEKHDEELAGIREQRNSANGAYRNILKAAEKAGGADMRLSILWRLEKRGKDVKDLDRFHSWCNRIARLTNLPIGTQLGLFDDGQTVAAKVDAAAIKGEGAAAATAKIWDGQNQGPFNGMYTIDQLVAAAEAGEAAANGGEPRECPHEIGTPLADKWLQAFDAEAARLVSARPDAVEAEARA